MPEPDQDHPWPSPVHRHSRAELAAPTTQIARDIGRRIAEDQVELFVSHEAAPALQQQLERLAPWYIALHDIGTSASLQLLNALAGAAGAPVQRLSVRRQGAVLAVLQFVEVPLGESRHVRIYSTDVNADTQTRQQLAMVLLARCRLSVLMLGDKASPTLTGALAPIREAMTQVSWTNDDLLVLPLGSAGLQAAQAGQLVGRSGVNVRVTPQAARPHDAWSFISGAWNRQHAAKGMALNTDLTHAVPKPRVPSPEAPNEATASSRWDDYAYRCAAIKGVVSCRVYDLRSQRALAEAGGLPSAESPDVQGGLLIDTMANVVQSLGPGSTPPVAAISLGHQDLVVRPVPGHAGIVLQLVLQASANNLILAMQLERVAVPPAAGNAWAAGCAGYVWAASCAGYLWAAGCAGACA
jgi:hypothetical protein